MRADPIGLDGGINLYAYAEANPIIKIDIFGLKTCGSGWNEPLVPDNPYGYFRFSSCCEDHDKCYGTCGKTQAECDNASESCMLNKCKKLSYRPILKFKCEGMACRYAWAVRKWGFDEKPKRKIGFLRAWGR